MRKIVPVVLLVAGFQAQVFSQASTRTAALKLTATEQAIKERDLQTRLVTLAKAKNWPLVTTDRYGATATLTGVDALGYPIYTGVYNNIISAATIGTSRLWPGGIAGLSLTGSSPALKDKLVLWDGGRVRASHVEINNRVVHRDNASSLSDHSTHVAGIMMAAGTKPEAKGMAFDLQELVVYDFTSNGSEMMTESANDILLSNHSYGTISGWYSTDGHWEFRGQAGTTEDYKFGFYSDDTQLWDSIVWNAPYHLIVKSAGNNRSENGPAVGQPYYRYDGNNNMNPAGNRPDGIYSNDGYDIIPTTGTAKNILTVGAVNPLTAGYTNATAVSVASFSSWGPTDDGRIKPDVVADGVGVLSCVSSTDNSYSALSGTSMASPAAAGSLLLLQEYYSSLHSGNFMRASSLKGLVIHTADEAGTAAGPDYIYGWGLINMQKAAAVIKANNAGDLIQENVLNNGQTASIPVIASGRGPLVATICWTDPKGTPHALQVDNNSIKLIHDLDIRIKKGSTTYLPWTLNPAAPDAAATKGDNIRDNVEKVEITDVVPGATYTIEITHKGTLERGSQIYSLIVSGVGGSAYCNTSAPLSTAGARIDQVSFAGILQSNASGCTAYSDLTSITGTIETNSTIPFTVKVNSCDGSSTSKIVKAFIDFNLNGDFTDAGEMIVESGVLNGDQEFTTNVTIPAGLTAGDYSVMRVIVEETSNAADVLPCGPYTKGETQDYRIGFALPSKDVGITGIISPLSTLCNNNAQYVTIAVKNTGTSAISNIALSGTVKAGATTVATLTGTYAPSIAAQDEINYTFQTPFAATPATTYAIQVNAVLTGDQNAANDEQTMSATVNALQNVSGTEAEICNNSNVLFKANGEGADVFLWYDQLNATVPLAVGSSAMSTVIKADKTYYVGKNDLNNKTGAASKMDFTSGSYASYSGHFVKFTSSVPLTIENIKLYTGYPGKIEIIVADFGSYTSSSQYSFYPISSTIVDAYATRPTPMEGVQNVNDPADNGAVFAVNLSVPDPGDHIIIVRCSEGATIFRNDNIAVNPYPFTIPGILSITGNSAGGSTNEPLLYQKYYYFLYDVSVRLSNCPSNRVAVVATPSVTPVATMNGNVLASNVATGNQWYLNGNLISNATNQMYTPLQSGSYETTVTDAFGCSSTSNKVDYTYTGNLPGIMGIVISPNPNDGHFKLDFLVTRQADIDISIVNTLGQVVYSSNRVGFLGPFSENIIVGKLATGVYVLHVRHDKKSYSKKMIVQ